MDNLNQPSNCIKVDQSACLFIVGTPIGNLQDMSPRAIDVLKSCDLILAEDTRHSIFLLQHFAIPTPLKSYHQHNEQQRTGEIISLLENSKKIGLITDAGMPMISDPGYILVKEALIRNIKVSVVPGPTALTSAISISGIDCKKFSFEGFLPSKPTARLNCLVELANNQHNGLAIVLYEAPHRLIETIQDIMTVFGAERVIAVVKEITKQYENIYYGTSQEVLNKLLQLNSIKGEYVIVISASEKIKSATDADEEKVLKALKLFKAENITSTQAVKIITKLYGLKKNYVYDLALRFAND
jgi:16S rRNA (cytidine1402-2'-O)-methyltransferase